MKNQVSIQWSELSLVGSVVLFVTNPSLWLGSIFLGLSIFGVFCRYAIEMQQQKATAEAMADAIKSISSGIQGSKSSDASLLNEQLVESYSKLFDFGALTGNKKTPH
ncbi:MAG: hypothetical protein CME70_18710 [Halobacteriovorax sp.]|nr:hypothetical protein [Halobacteriovorax sp.]